MASAFDDPETAEAREIQSRHTKALAAVARSGEIDVNTDLDR